MQHVAGDATCMCIDSARCCACHSVPITVVPALSTVLVASVSTLDIGKSLSAGPILGYGVNASAASTLLRD